MPPGNLNSNERNEMNHAIKEEIVSSPLELTYLVYVEVEPQPPEWTVKVEHIPGVCWRCVGNDLATEIMPIGDSPISIGDTVYQGEEWWAGMGFNNLYVDVRLKRTPSLAPSHTTWIDGSGDRPPQTMPMKLADKTFKVVGVEVEVQVEVKTEELNIAKPEYMPIPATRVFEEGIWFWKYSLEEIN